MDLRVNPDAIGLGAYQGALAIVGLVILVALTWRMLKAVTRRMEEDSELGQMDWFALAWPPVAWLVVLLAGGIAFSSMQAFGPRVAIPKTPLHVNAPDAPVGGVRDLSPHKLTDEERLQEQRQLERETRGRVDLKQ